MTFEPAGTSNEGCAPGWVSPGNWQYGWATVQTPWAGVNMTQMGYPVPYDVRSRTRSAGMFRGQMYIDSPDGVWVPVVEVQSVLRDECVAAGTCAPPGPTSR
jgi:hypothetical protein